MIAQHLLDELRRMDDGDLRVLVDAHHHWYCQAKDVTVCNDGTLVLRNPESSFYTTPLVVLIPAGEIKEIRIR